jgi:hypothetical protein
MGQKSIQGRLLGFSESIAWGFSHPFLKFWLLFFDVLSLKYPKAFTFANIKTEAQNLRGIIRNKHIGLFCLTGSPSHSIQPFNAAL